MTAANDFLAGRTRQMTPVAPPAAAATRPAGAVPGRADPNALLAGASPPPAEPDPNAFLSGSMPSPPPPSAGPLDIRPAARVAGQVAGAVIPEPVQDFVGDVGRFFASRLGALGATFAEPLLGPDLSPEAIRGLMLKYPFLDPQERAAIQSWGPSRDVPVFRKSEKPFDPVGGAVQFGSEVWQALSKGTRPKGKPQGTMELLASRGFTEPFGPTAAQAEEENRRLLGLPLGSLGRGLTSPEAAALGLETAGVPLLNAAGKIAAPVGAEAARRALDFEARLPRALAKVPVPAVSRLAGKEVRTRALPGVKEVLEFTGPEQSLPNRFRRQIEDILRTREGQADFRAFLREKALGKHTGLKEAVQDEIADAIERRDIRSLTPDKQAVANALQGEYVAEVVARRRAGLKKFELGGHIEPLRQRTVREVLKAADAAKDARYLQEGRKALIAAERKEAVARAAARRAERGYLSTGEDKAFQRMTKAKTAHAATIDKVKLYRTIVSQYKGAGVTAAQTLSKARKAARRLQNAAQVRVRTGSLQEIAQDIADAARFEGVDFAKRVLTKEKVVEAKGKPYGAAITPAGLSTGKLRRRLSSRFRTSKEINEASLRKRGYRAFEPVVQASLKGGAANDSRVLNAGIVMDAVRRWGRAARPGEGRTVGTIYGAKSGFRPQIQKMLDNTVLPDEVHDYLERLNVAMQPERYGRWVNGVRTVNNLFKKWALFSPGFISRNVQNNMLQTSIYGNTNPANWSEAFHLRRKLARAKSLDDLKSTYVRVGKANVRADKYVESAIKRGVIGRGQTTIETGKSFAEGRFNLFKAVRSANEFAEETSRIAFDLHLQRTGMTALEAARKVDQVLFRYSRRFESGAKAFTRRYAIPFINWTSQIIPLVFRSAIERPGSVGIIASAVEKRNVSQGFTQERLQKLGTDIREQGGIVIRKNDDGTVRIVKPTGYGSYDANPIINAVVNKDVVALVDDLASRAYPQINVPYALLRGKDPLTGAELTGKPVPGPPALKLLFLSPAGKAWANKHGIFQDPRDSTLIRVPDRLNIVLRSIPPLRLASIAADIVKPDVRAGRRALSFGAGVSEVERNPVKQEFYQVRDTKEGIAEAMKILRRYPPEARWRIAQQFPVGVRRVLVARGVIQPQ